MEHECHEFACTECQQPATHLHRLPQELNQTIAQKMHKPPPYLYIIEDRDEDYEVQYLIKSGGITKYYLRIPGSQFKLSSRWKEEIAQRIAAFRQGEDLDEYTEGRGQDYYVIIPGIFRENETFYKDKSKLNVDYTVQYLLVCNRDDNFYTTYSMKYLPAFLEMLDDIERRILAASEK